MWNTMKLLKLLRRPLNVMKTVSIGKESDPLWLKRLKRFSTVVIAIASAVAAATSVCVLLLIG